jgi:hypothetical protein
MGLGVIELSGPGKEADLKEQILKHCDLAKNKFKVEIATMVATPDIPKLLKAIDTTALPSVGDPRKIPRLIEELLKPQIPSALFLPSDTLSQGIIATYIGSLLALYAKQPEIIRDNAMVRSLLRLGVLEPKLQITICTSCGHNHLSFGSFPHYEIQCPQCHREPHYARVHTLNKTLEGLKRSNENDLPTFVARYIQAESISVLNPANNKSFPPDVELDVYMEESGCDIECRNLLRDHLAAGTADVKRFARGLFQQKIEKKAEVLDRNGIKRIIFVTNLPHDDAARLQKELDALAEASGRTYVLRVAGSEIPGLLKLLNEEIELACKLKT